LKRWKKLTLLLLLITVPVFYITAQSTVNPSTSFVTPDMPQWVKDLRRWEIVAFGSIPFSIFFATFAMDMYRWNNANGMKFTPEGRRYAPWPMKSAGGVIMDWKERELVFIYAAGLSATIAFADLAIVQIKRYRARKRAEALPVGTTIITRTPLPEEPSDEQDGTGTDEETPDSPSAEKP
jgi:hypothetical protein